MKTLVTLIILYLCCSNIINAQQHPVKTINYKTQYWISMNANMRFTKKLSLMADYHERIEGDFKHVNFYFMRVGLSYWINENFTLTGGYAHLWLNKKVNTGFTLADQNRIYQQVIWKQKINNLSFLYRIRNEQRWQQELNIDGSIKTIIFSNRLRFLFGITIPIFKKNELPKLTVSDELMAQFGKDITLNTFDQNRLFLGMKQKITKDLSFDLGYMMVYQQKSTGYNYDFVNTVRLFFYYKPNFTKAIKN